MRKIKPTKILICGILPPPHFGHSVMYQMLMDSSFPNHFDVTFLNLHFWSYGKHKKVTLEKLLKMGLYLAQYIWFLIVKRPRYVLYNMSFDRMPFLKDFLFCAIGRLFGAKIVLHDMGQYLRELYDASGPFYQKMIRWLTEMSTASIIMGHQTKSVYEGFMKEEQLFVVPGCVKDSHDLVIDDLTESDSNTTIKVLYFSYISESKGGRVAIQAAEKILKQKKDLCFKFAGPLESESMGEALRQLVRDYPGQAEYLGYIDNEKDRTRLFREADIFIFPTQRDVFGLVLLHALAEGVPVVATREGNIPEIIHEGVNGFLVEKGSADQLAEAIIRLAGDDLLRSELKRVNRHRYKTEYTLDIFGERMVRVFKELDSQFLSKAWRK